MTRKTLFTSPIIHITPNERPGHKVVHEAPIRAYPFDVDKPTTAATPVYHGVACSPRASAIVSLQRTDATTSYCIGIEMPGSDLAAVERRVRQLAESLGRQDRIVIDRGGGMGNALWLTLGDPRRDRRYIAVSEQGRLRQLLVDSLVAAVTREKLKFVPGVAHEAQMRPALESFNRVITDDGQLGSELVSALACALHVKRTMPPQVY